MDIAVHCQQFILILGNYLIALFEDPYRNEVYKLSYATQTFYSNCLFDHWNLYKILQKYNSCVFDGLKPRFSSVEVFEQP